MNETRSTVAFAFRLVAMAMAALCIALLAIDVGTFDEFVILLAIGLFSLPLASILERGS
jgi:predicted Rossmann-fold nucleotide-binding protein